MIRSTLWRSFTPVRCRACGDALIDENGICPACGARQTLSKTTVDPSITFPTEQRTRWSIVPVRNRMVVPYPSIREASETQTGTQEDVKLAVRQARTRRIATAVSSSLALVIGAIALTNQHLPPRATLESKAHSASGPIAARASNAPPAAPPTSAVAAVAAGPAAGPLLMIAPAKLASNTPPQPRPDAQAPLATPPAPAHTAVAPTATAAGNLADTKRAVRSALRKDQLANARSRVQDIPAAQRDADMRRLASQVAQREHERDMALAHAHSCEKVRNWPCVVRSANGALALDRDSIEAHGLLQQAAAGGRTQHAGTALAASRNAGPVMTSLTAELTTERRLASVQPAPEPLEPAPPPAPELNPGRGRGNAH